MTQTLRLEPVRTLTHGNAVFSAAFSPNGKQIATASLDNTVRLWNLSDGEVLTTLKGHGDGVCFVDFHSDGRIVTASLDRTLHLVGGRKSAPDDLHRAPDYLTCAAIARNGTLLVSGGFDKTVRVWDSQTELNVVVWTGHTENVQCVAISGDGKTVASGGDDQTIRLWNVESQSVSKVVMGHSKGVEGLAFSPDGTLLASASVDGSVRLWSRTGEPVATLEQIPVLVKSVVFSPDGRWLVSGDGIGTMRVWDTANLQLVLTAPAHKNSIHDLTFSRDGTHFASAGFDRTIHVWSVVEKQD